MPGFLTFLFNPYDRKARLQPALLCAFPLFVSIILLIPEFGMIWAAVSGFTLYCGGITFLTQTGRDRGKALESELFQSWGGKPSAAMLRHSDKRLDTATKKRYRNVLERTVPDLRLASVDEELSCPQQADDGYESATAWLLAHTRDHERFALLFRENINYGFRRNIWALKRPAFIIDGVVVAFIMIRVFDLRAEELAITIQTFDLHLWTSIALTILHVCFFSFKIQKAWVLLAAETYARQLLAACDILKTE